MNKDILCNSLPVHSIGPVGGSRVILVEAQRHCVGTVLWNGGDLLKDLLGPRILSNDQDRLNLSLINQTIRDVRVVNVQPIQNRRKLGTVAFAILYIVCHNTSSSQAL